MRVSHVDSLLQVAALPFSDEEMEPIAYKIDLPESKQTVLSISHKTLGVWSRSKMIESNSVFSKPLNFKYKIQLIK